MTIKTEDIPKPYLGEMARLAAEFFKDPKNREEYEAWKSSKHQKGGHTT